MLVMPISSGTAITLAMADDFSIKISSLLNGRRATTKAWGTITSLTPDSFDKPSACATSHCPLGTACTAPRQISA
ncbi:hypothetical protein D3C75_739540 [compost metagenome]